MIYIGEREPASFVYLWHHPQSHFNKLLTQALFFGPCMPLFIYFRSISSLSRTCCSLQVTYIKQYRSKGRIQPVRFGGAILVIFGSQVSIRVHHCKRDEEYFTTLLWQRIWTAKWPYNAKAVFQIVQNFGNKVTFVGLRGFDRPIRPAFDPSLIVCSRRSLDFVRSRFIRTHPVEPELPSTIKHFLKRNS